MAKKEVKGTTPLKFKADDIPVVIIHYNTPELTSGCIRSLLKNGGLGNRLKVVLFDNSDQKPFPKTTGVKIIDNTKGQIVNFDEELAKFPDRCSVIGCSRGCVFGSAKHMMTVQKLWELVPTGFILMESDILIRTSIAEFVRPEYSFVGHYQKAQPYNPFGIGRILPMLCYMNVPKLVKHGARYFDPTRSYGLLPGGKSNRNNWYDTGAVMLEDILLKRPLLKGLHLNINPFIIHYGSASWQNNNKAAHMRWLNENKALWL